MNGKELRPVIVAKVHRWVIIPSFLSLELLRSKWDVVLLLEGPFGLASTVQELVEEDWKVEVGVPSRILKDFAQRNQALLYPTPGSVPPLTGALEKRHSPAPSSAQDLELSDELLEWINKFKAAEGAGAVTMLNILAFKEGMKSEYLKYGQAFSESVGVKRGGNAKLVGNILSPSHYTSRTASVDGQEKQWDEFAMAHYPTISHFADMIASKDYQEVNHKHRLPSLKDTLIICATDLELPSVQERAAKL